jgi:hypothetical protein
MPRCTLSRMALRMVVLLSCLLPVGAAMAQPASQPAHKDVDGKLMEKLQRVESDLGKLVGQQVSPAALKKVEKLRAELVVVQKKLANVEAAIKKGLDPALVKEPRQRLTADIERLTKEIAANKPTAGRPSLLENLLTEVRALRTEVKAASGSKADRKGAGAAKKADGTEEKPDEPIGLSIEMELESIYYNRGLNSFQANALDDQHAVFCPVLTYQIASTGFWLNYTGHYQLNGPNVGEMVASGTGHEQNFVLGYDGEFLDGALALSAYFNFIFYPFASEDVAGTKVPIVLEPGFALAYNGPISVGVEFIWSYGVQEAIEDGRYLYINPSLGKEIQLLDRLSLSMAFALGIKVFHDFDANTENMWDLLFDVEFPVAVRDNFSVTPGVHVGWTDLESVRVGQEYVFWFSLKMGISL